MRATLRGRVTIAAMLSAALVFALSGVAVVVAFAISERQELDRTLESDHLAAARKWMEVTSRGADPDMDKFLREQTEQVWQVYLDGELVNVDDGPLNFHLPAVNEEWSFVEAEGQRHRVYSGLSFISGPSGRPRIQVARSTAEMDARVGRVRLIVMIAGLLGTLLVAIPARWLARVALRPLPLLRDGARGISSTQDLGRRMSVEGPEEVREVAWAMNRMLERLQEQVGQTEAALQATRTFTADAGHELRTPLTSLRANVEVLGRDELSREDRRRALRDCLHAHRRLTALIDSLQTLARGDAAVGRNVERLDLGELVDAVVVDARRRYPGTDFDLAGSEVAPVEGDAEGLRMMLDNLIENAARHGGSRVCVHLKRGPGFVRVSVDDDGPGIPQAERARVFERFSRGSAARNGTGSGLGLAIAAQQAELHGSRLKLTDSPLGGARFELTLSAPSSS